MKRITLRERCFGCGDTRLVDIDPRWEDILIEQPKGAPEGWGFCQECSPKIRQYMEREGRPTMGMLDQLDDALGVRSWLSRKTSGAGESIYHAARALRSVSLNP